jgi:hypothetical protein
LGNVVSFVVKLAADGLSEDGETSVMLLVRDERDAAAPVEADLLI